MIHLKVQVKVEVVKFLNLAIIMFAFEFTKDSENDVCNAMLACQPLLYLSGLVKLSTLLFGSGE
jgi:hypothetical protein